MKKWLLAILLGTSLMMVACSNDEGGNNLGYGSTISCVDQGGAGCNIAFWNTTYGNGFNITTYPMEGHLYRGFLNNTNDAYGRGRYSALDGCGNGIPIFFQIEGLVCLSYGFIINQGPDYQTNQFVFTINGFNSNEYFYIMTKQINVENDVDPLRIYNNNNGNQSNKYTALPMGCRLDQNDANNGNAACGSVNSQYRCNPINGTNIGICSQAFTFPQY